MEYEDPVVDELPNFDTCGALLKELFKDFNADVDAETAETAHSPRKNSLPETEGEKAEPSKKRKNIVILEDEEIEEFQSKQLAKTLSKELKGLFVDLKPGTTIDMVRSSSYQASTKQMQATC